MVPLMQGSLPYQDFHAELVSALLDLDQALSDEYNTEERARP